MEIGRPEETAGVMRAHLPDGSTIEGSPQEVARYMVLTGRALPLPPSKAWDPRLVAALLGALTPKAVRLLDAIRRLGEDALTRDIADQSGFSASVLGPLLGCVRRRAAKLYPSLSTPFEVQGRQPRRRVRVNRSFLYSLERVHDYSMRPESQEP